MNYTHLTFYMQVISFLYLRLYQHYLYLLMFSKIGFLLIFCYHSVRRTLQKHVMHFLPIFKDFFYGNAKLFVLAADRTERMKPVRLHLQMLKSLLLMQQEPVELPVHGRPH